MLGTGRVWDETWDVFGMWPCLGRDVAVFETWPCFRDRLTHNDIIGTTYLCMSKISAPGGELEGKGGRQDVAHGA